MQPSTFKKDTLLICLVIISCAAAAVFWMRLGDDHLVRGNLELREALANAQLHVENMTNLMRHSPESVQKWDFKFTGQALKQWHDKHSGHPMASTALEAAALLDEQKPADAMAKIQTISDELK